MINHPPIAGQELPASVWPVGQRPSRLQRRGRYLPASMAHPAKMLPSLAAHAIATFTEPGDVVLDPMCGIGTTLVEAAHLGRRSVGIEYEPRWARLAGANLAHAGTQGATGQGTVLLGDARQIAPTLCAEYAGRVSLLLTSPPYGGSTHGHARATPGRGVRKVHHSYGTDRTNLAHRGLAELLDGFTAILTACHPLLRPGGTLLITTRPWRRAGHLVDFPTLALNAAIAAGYTPVQRCIALLAALRDAELITRASFFQMYEARKHHAAGLPVFVIAHEDALVLSKAPDTQPHATAQTAPTPPYPARVSAHGRHAA